MINEIKAIARGGWKEIVSRLCNVTPDFLSGQHGPCPVCGGKDRFRAYDDFDETGGTICNQCGPHADGIATVAWLCCTDTKGAVRRLSECLELKKGGKAQPTDRERRLRDQVYRLILSQLSLSEQHRSDLKRRGLTDDEINRRGYVSLSRRDIAELPRRIEAALNDDRFEESELLPCDEITRLVPGLLLDARGRLRLASLSGILIPLRNTDGLVVAMIVRRDQNDRGSGGCKYLCFSASKRQRQERQKRDGVDYPTAEYTVHVPIDVTVGCETLRVTEGALKADVTTALSGTPTVGMPGVTIWKNAVPVLRKLAPKRIVIALDADHKQNPAVADSLAGLVRACQKEKFDVAIETWDIADGKGIDDLLANGRQPDVVSGAAVEKYLREHVDAVASQYRKTAKPSLSVAQSRESVDDPHRLARTLIERRFMQDGFPSLHCWRSEWYRWDGSRYVILDVAELRALVTRHVKREFDRASEARSADPDAKAPGEIPQTRKVTRAIVTNVIQALESITHLPGTVTQPSYLGNDPAPFDVQSVFATRSGLLELSATARVEPAVFPLTPRYFSCRLVNYGFDLTATCPEWLDFLASIWPNDQASISMLQEFIGYCLTDDTAQQKFLLMIGPPRSGKGTIGRILVELIGREHVASPTLGSLAGPFGLWPLLRKSVALVPDARLSARSDAVPVVERLLSVVGEDAQDIDRKCLPPLTAVQMPLRFVLMSNEVPTFNDASAAIATRALILRMTNSFFGKEDRSLQKRLAYELPGILNWAIAGWQRLQNHGQFTQPESGLELLADLKRQASPISEFLEDYCEIGPEFSVSIPDLFNGWKRWCYAHGRDQTGTETTFGRNLRAAVAGLTDSRPRSGQNRVRMYVGLRLKPDVAMQPRNVF